MSIQRPTHAPDPYTRPATVSYSGQHVAQSGIAPSGAQQTQQQWAPPPPPPPQQHQQQQQQPTPSYNPNQYPLMPSAAQGPQQQSNVYNQQGYAAAPAGRPPEQQAQHQHQHQHRWSVAGQLPPSAGGPTYQQPSDRQSHYASGPPQPSGGAAGVGYGQTAAPPPPPKNDGYGQVMQQQHPVQQYQQGVSTAPPQNYQYNQQAQGQQYAYPAPSTNVAYAQPPVSAPPPAQSPQQSFHQQPPVQGHAFAQQPQQQQQQQPYNQYQQQAQNMPAQQQWPQQANPNLPQTYQHQGHQQQQQYQQSHASHSQQSYVLAPQAQASIGGPHARRDEPVSPITASRHSVAGAQVSRPNSNHIPSRSNSYMGHSQDNAPPPQVNHIPRQDSSPISAMNTSTSAFAPKRKVVDPNGIGSTGPTALGMGGPSDWENFGPAEFEVDDLDYYTAKQEPKGVTKVKEGKTDGEPVELPAEDGMQQPWQAGAVEIDSGSPINARPLSYAQPAANSQAAGSNPQHGYPINQASTNLNVQPQQGGYPMNHAINQQQAQSHNVHMASPEPGSDPERGWRPSPQLTQTSTPATQQYQAYRQPGSSAVVDAGRTVPTRPDTAPQAQNAYTAPPAGGHSAMSSSTPPPSVAGQHGDLSALQRKLTQTESELAQFKDREVENRLDGEKNLEQLQVLKGRVAQLEDECRVAQNECVKLENSLEAMETASVTAANEKASIEASHSALVVEKDSWEKERSGLALKIGEAEVALSKIRAEQSGWDVERATLTTRTAELETTLVTLEAERSQWNAERVTLVAKITELELALTQAKTEANGTRDDLLRKITVAEQALSTAKNDADAASTGYQAKLKASEDTIALSKSEAEVARKELEELKAKPVDIAPGLGEWYKGSLARFSVILFEEEAAVSVPEKMRKFQGWVNSEAQLRGIDMKFQPQVSATAVQPQTTVGKNTDGDTQSSRIPPKLQTEPSSASDQSDDIQYSPGGRPIMHRTITDNKSVSDVSVASQNDSLPVIGTAGEKKAFLAYRAGSSISQGSDSRSNSAPSAQSAQLPVVANAPVLTTKPLAYQKPKFVKPVEDTPAPTLKSSSSVPILAGKSTPGPLLPKDETFLPDSSTFDKVQASGAGLDATLPVGLKPKTPAPFAQFAVASSAAAPPTAGQASHGLGQKSKLPPLEELQDMLPRVAMPSIPMSHPSLAAVNAALSTFADGDFTFVIAISSQWEATAAEKKRRLDAERARRQAEAEDRTSQLFQDGAIGYGDIGELEEANKQQEFERQEQETNEEWQSYRKDVFGVVFERLQKDIGGLIQVRTEIEGLCQRGVAGQEALDAASRPDAPDRAVNLVDALTLLIRVHTLLVAREVELDKAVVERDRRYKQNSTRSLYRKGQIKKMKEQEVYFDKLERKTEVERRREHLKNAGLLMKDVKAAVGRGCDENEAFAASLLAAIRQLALDDSAAVARRADAQAAVARAADVLAELALSSTALMRHYARVDALLNDVEYEHEVALERVSDAAGAVFEELRAQKAKQDGLLIDEAGKREAAVDKTLQEWRAELAKFVAVMGLDDAAGAAAGAGAAGHAGEGEEEKKRRLQAALEIAKRRNGDL